MKTFNQFKRMLNEAVIADVGEKYSKIISEITDGIETKLRRANLGDVRLHDPQAMKASEDIYQMWSVDLSTNERERFMDITTEQFEESEICTAVRNGFGKNLREDEDDLEVSDHDDSDLTVDDEYRFVKIFQSTPMETEEEGDSYVLVEVCLVKEGGNVYHKNYPAFEVKMKSQLADA